MAGLIRQGHFLRANRRSGCPVGVLSEHGGNRQADALVGNAGDAGGNLQQGRALVLGREHGRRGRTHAAPAGWFGGDAVGAGVLVFARVVAERIARTAVADRHHGPAIRPAINSGLAGDAAQQFSRYRARGRGVRQAADAFDAGCRHGDLRAPWIADQMVRRRWPQTQRRPGALALRGACNRAHQQALARPRGATQVRTGILRRPQNPSQWRRHDIPAQRGANRRWGIAGFGGRDFECSFFAGALLCPRIPFRRFLIRESHSVNACHKVGVTPALVMRRMTAVSPYRHWHFFDAYPPGYLRAVYRGNGIPLPWGNMSLVSDPCPRWAVFRLLQTPDAPSVQTPKSQISVMQDGKRARLYCCHSLQTRDALDELHVLSVGVDLLPALEAQGFDGEEIVSAVADSCRRGGGDGAIPAAASSAIRAASQVLNISWIADALGAKASVICPRSGACPRHPRACA